MTRGMDSFEAFQGRVWRVAAAAACVLLAGAALTVRPAGPVVAGLAAGCAASLAAHAIKVRALRRLADGASHRRTMGGALLGRLAVWSAALGAGAAWPGVSLYAAAGGLLLVNAVTVALAAIESLRPRAEAR